MFFMQKNLISQSENDSPNIHSQSPKVNNATSVVVKDTQTSTNDVTLAKKSCQKMNGIKKNETNNESSNTNEQENGTNSGHSSSNESNNVDKRKKGQDNKLLP